jgi:hypothetical protein
MDSLSIMEERQQPQNVRNDSGGVPGRYRYPLVWRKVEPGHYAEASGRYDIFRDGRTWVLSSSMHEDVRCNLLCGAMSEAGILEAREAPVRVDPQCSIARGVVVRDGYDWVVVRRDTLGGWAQVAGPLPSRSEAREVVAKAWHDRLRSSEHRRPSPA